MSGSAASKTTAGRRRQAGQAGRQAHLSSQPETSTTSTPARRTTRSATPCLYVDNRTLYSFKPDDSVNPVPDLATGRPEISADNKTITVHIKKGVKYSPPVNREIKAQDIKYAFERAFSKHVPSGYAGTYFNSIVGTPAKPNTGEIKPISGIETPDDNTIVFKLKTGEGAARLAGARDADHDAGPEGVRQEVRRQDAVDVRPVRRRSPARTWSRTTPTGKLIGRVAGQADRPRPQPQLGQVDRLPAGLPRRDQHPGGQRRPGHGVAPRPERLGDGLLRLRRAAGPGAQAGAGAQQGPGRFVPAGGTRYISLNTNDQAVRQHQHP